MGYTYDEPMPVAIAGGTIEVEPDTDSNRETTQQDILAALTTPVAPASLGGVWTAVKVNQVGAGTASIAAADADEAWDVGGWSLSFTAACTLTISMDDDDAALQYVFDVPGAGIWDREPNLLTALFSGNVNEPVGFTITAGNMRGIVYVRKPA